MSRKENFDDEKQMGHHSYNNRRFVIESSWHNKHSDASYAQAINGFVTWNKISVLKRKVSNVKISALEF